MWKKTWKTYALWIAICEATGLLAGLLIRTGVEYYGKMVEKPPLSPPQWVFPVVWTLLYALMGISAARITLNKSSAKRSRSLNLMVAQLILNFFWPLLFFNAMVFGVALVWLAALWVLVLLMILQFYQVEPLAARLQVPYALWLSFALYLNAGVWYLAK